MQELSTSEIEASVKELELKLERLRVFYEQYFLGLLKREPTVQLKDCVRLMRMLDQQNIRNTALRYRLRGATQKFNTYRTYWGRTVRAIEAGTYKRDVARAARNMEKRGIKVPNISKARSVGDFERAIREAAAKQASGKEAAKTTDPSPAPADPQPTPAPSPPHKKPATPPPPAQQSGISADEMQSIYRRFIKAKKMCGESTHSIRLESVAQTIERQLPRLKQKHGGRDIEFQVVIRAGRAVLKASPK